MFDEVPKTMAEAYDFYLALDRALGAAYDQAAEPARSRIYRLNREVGEEFAAISKNMIAKNTQDYKVITQELKNNSTRVKKLQDEIDDVVHSVIIANEVIAGLGILITLIAAV